MQVVHFSSLIQVCHQIASSLLASSNCIKSVKIKLCLLQLDICSLFTSCWNNLHEAHRPKAWQSTCKPVDSLQQALVIIKPVHASGDVNAPWYISAWRLQGNKPASDLLRLARFLVCTMLRYLFQLLETQTTSAYCWILHALDFNIWDIFFSEFKTKWRPVVWNAKEILPRYLSADTFMIR